jgi:predicted small lipoprotein YifL
MKALTDGSEMTDSGDARRVHRLRGACAGLAVLLLWGCGQKGPLYLPDKKGTTVVKPAPPSPEAATPPEKIDPQKKDDTEIPPTP